MKSMFRPLLVAAAIASAVSPIAANAGTSASFSASNMYLFRGLDVSKGNAQVAGSLDYAHDTGLYAGIWTTSAGSTQEYDLYAGFKGEVSGFGYEIGLIDYNYPGSEGAKNEDIGDQSEIMLGFTAGPAAFKVYSSLQGDNSTVPAADAYDSDSSGAYQYYSLSYTTDMMGVTLGVHDLSDDALETDTMTHLDVSYFATDELTLTVSQVVANAETAPDVDKYNDDTMFLATYSKKFDL
jgi:uncharacterized protein (TIGR02001 family)